MHFLQFGQNSSKNGFYDITVKSRSYIWRLISDQKPTSLRRQITVVCWRLLNDHYPTSDHGRVLIYFRSDQRRRQFWSGWPNDQNTTVMRRRINVGCLLLARSCLSTRWCLEKSPITLSRISSRVSSEVTPIKIINWF